MTIFIMSIRTICIIFEIFFLLLVDDLKPVWKNLRESYTRCKRDSEKIMRSGAKASKLPSRQFYDIMRFLEDNTDQENHYVISNITEDSQQNKEENDAEEETGVEAIGRRSLNPGKRKQALGYGNTDEKRLMDSLNNVDR